MNKDKLKGIAMGLIMTLMFSAQMPQTLAKNLKETILVSYSNIKIVINDVTIDPRDGHGRPVEPFIYNGTTYLPIRAVGEIMGMVVGWNDATQTVTLDDRPGPGEKYTFSNDRFGYRVDYPATWGRAVVPDYDDGALLLALDGVEVRVYAEHAPLTEQHGLEDYMALYYPLCREHPTKVPGAQRAFLLTSIAGEYQEVLIAERDRVFYTVLIDAQTEEPLEGMSQAMQKLVLEGQDVMASLRIH